MQQRLKAVGLRPINALVDVTNYISQDRGRPLHVYDADKLKGAVRARLGKAARNSSASTARNMRSTRPCASSPTTTDRSGFGGIMGGEDSGSTEATVNVLIESAYFDPARTAATGRKTGARHGRTLSLRAWRRSGVGASGPRSGDGHDPEARGRQAVEGEGRGQAAGRPRVIAFDFARVAKLAGHRGCRERDQAILEKLGCAVAGKGKASR